MTLDIKNGAGRKVYVGLSGGVDSSVSAFLLKEAGYDVTGVFIKAWYPDFIDCNWRDEMRDAMRVCAKLEIPFLVCDLEKEYKENVVDYLVSEYKEGRTPNPDVMCNKHIKFEGFLNFALKQGADFIATGHYAQNIKYPEAFLLSVAKDKEKDQTYFLWTLKQNQLEKVLFPIGHLEKSEVRKIAKRAGLLTAEKKDSQGLCFLGHVDIENFLSHFLELKSGDVLDTQGNKIGIHHGSLLYTIGQRHGFKINAKDVDRDKYYVIEKDISNNTITVCDKDSAQEEENLNTKYNLKEVNISSPELFKKNEQILCRYRYRGMLKEIKINLLDIKENTAEINFIDLTENLAQGQSVVFYSSDKNSKINPTGCLGGGVIS